MTPEPKFLRRFEQLRTSLRRYQIGLGLAATLLVAATTLGLLAWSDYRYELPRSTRSVGLAVASLLALGVLRRWLIAPLQWWTQPRTAAEIEDRFPELGQRIRTVVQFASQGPERITAEGVKPSLVRALEVDTDERSTPLPLDRIVRWRRVLILGGLAAIPVGLLVLATSLSPEWRIALDRALLIERPYTSVEVKPGDVLIDQGADVPVEIAVLGRPRASVVFQTRPAGKKDAAWKSEKLDGKAQATVAKVKDPVEYRVVAGPAISLAHTIHVRYPLVIRSIEVEIKAPEYTGLDPKTVKGGDVQAVEGSVATFKIALDGVPSTASLELVDPALKKPEPGQPAPPPTILPLRREGDQLVATLDLTKDLTYQVVARTDDGRILPRNKHRIDVIEDRAPRVTFDEPDEALEIHTLAEVRNRARVADDFGLTKAGIVFRFNDGEEKTLILKDFPPTPGQKPKTAATLEEVLLTETLGASPQDSVTYYAFAEDNFPGEARRTETDLRYIDFRRFKREYKLAEGGAPGEGEDIDLIALDELIGRQRINLNRATRLAKRRSNDRTEADDPLKVAGFEEALLNLTKEFTAGIEQLVDERVDELHKALDAMQAAVDALDQSKNADAPPAMAEALKHLVAARRDLLELIGGNPALAKSMRAFNRRQAQKIRKPKNKEEEAEEIADRLEQLAQEEELVYATIAQPMGDSDPNSPNPGDAPKGKPTEPKAAAQPPGELKTGEPKDPAKGATKAPDGTKGDGPPGQAEAQNEAKDPGKPGSGEAKGAGDPSQEATKGQNEPKGPEGAASENPKADRKGEGQEKEGNGGAMEPKKLDRRAVTEKQEQIADEVRDLEEKLKRLEAVSDLAKARMGQAAEKVEQASGALSRGNTKEAADDAKTSAGMLHELARQVKGEITREAADELAMARDLADELSRREAEFAERTAGPGPAADPGDQEAQGKAGQGKEGQGKDAQAKDAKDAEGKDGQGESGEGKNGQSKEGKDGQGAPGQGSPGMQPGQGGRGGSGGWAGLTEEEQIDRMAEMAKTLEAWLKQVERRGEGKSAEAVREILDEGNVAEIVERTERMGDLRVGGKRPELSREAKDLADKLETIGEALAMLHQGIVAPEMAALVEFDRRLAELTAKLATLNTPAAADAWKREAAALIRDLEKAGIAGVDELADSLQLAGGWHWDTDHRHYVGPVAATTALRTVSVQIKDRIQDLILKDLAAARDESTPPMFRELVERYYEVISQGARVK